MRYYLSPSLMCMDMMKLTEQLRLNSKADRLHVDIMDGHYVKNLALSASFVAQIRPYTSLPIDVHLMVEAPASFIPALLDAGADAFSLHPRPSAAKRSGLSICFVRRGKRWEWCSIPPHRLRASSTICICSIR